ncbi:MAG: TolC family protein [Bacteroidia bacterium]|nr:TolC family protein [Bacteroidia bacterium]
MTILYAAATRGSVLLLSWLGPMGLYAQSPDSLPPLTLDLVWEMMATGHPVARQADLLPARAQANLRMARGGFDPKIYGAFDQKNYKGDTYYSHLDAGVKIPTRLGLELKAGYEAMNGVYINPENTVPEAGLTFAGATLPIGQGLVIDARRAALQQARIFADAAANEQVSILNDLYMEAAEAYWAWAAAYTQARVWQQAVAIAEVRLEAIRISFLAGDKPAVDTLEARILLQTRQMDYNDALVQYRTASLMLSNFLWDENQQPLVITTALRPEDILQADRLPPVSAEEVSTWVAAAAEQHPDMIRLRYDLANLEVERRFKADKLKPKINLSYNVLHEPVFSGNNGSGDYPIDIQNNKWGLEASFPIFLREERGNLELTRLKIQETRLKQDMKGLEITNKIRSYEAELQTLDAQIRLFEAAVANYTALLRAEEQKFQAGESSIFLLNARESKLFESRIKLADLRGKYAKTEAALRWAAGMLYLEAN